MALRATPDDEKDACDVVWEENGKCEEKRPLREWW
jgi:hypothetical protein